MTYCNDSNPLPDNGKIAGYLIGEDNWGNSAVTEMNDKKVFLRWGNPNKYKEWYSLSFLKFDYFQEIDNSSKCFVGVMINKLGHKRYRIFKTRISNLWKDKDIITYPVNPIQTYNGCQKKEFLKYSINRENVLA